MEAVLYPVNSFGPIMKGLTIGGLGIFHVFTAHFAIGGGFLMCYLQWLAMTGRCPPARKFVDGYFKFLVLVSFITGALTGVGMWFTSIQVSAPTIAVMIDNFHWLWAVEWSFFCLEVVAGYSVYRYGHALTDRARLALFGLYTFAAWNSLFWINGILSFQLTPGDWMLTKNIWDGFFNPTFFPSLLYRTIAAWVIAALVGMVVVNFAPGFDRDEREQLVRRIAWMLAPMAAMPLLGLWFFGAMPADGREWVLGGSSLMNMLLNITLGSSTLIGLYAFGGLLYGKLYVNGATAAILCAMAFGATAGGEFIREGCRKPFSMRELMYSNAVKPEEVAELRVKGLTDRDPFPLRFPKAFPQVDGQPHPQLAKGALVFRQQCSICHTTDGVNSLPGLATGWDADMMRQNFSKLQKLKPFMPPFAGTPEELESLVQFVTWVQAGHPTDKWPDSLADPAAKAALLARIKGYLDAAGPEPATKAQRQYLADAGK